MLLFQTIFNWILYYAYGFLIRPPKVGEIEKTSLVTFILKALHTHANNTQAHTTPVFSPHVRCVVF